MSAVYIALAKQIEEAVFDTDPERRRTLLRDSAEYCLDRYAKTPEAERGILDDLLLAVLEKVEPDERSNAAERIAAMRRVPPRSLAYLAKDDLAVARPILVRFRGFEEKVLVDLCGTLAPPHLRVLATRADLPGPVVDALAARGDVQALEALVCGTATPLSDAAVAAVVRRTPESEKLTLGLAVRAGLPAGVRERMLALTEERARRSLEGDLGAPDAEAWMRETLPGVRAAFRAPLTPEMERGFAASRDFIATRFPDQAIGLAKIVRWASSNLAEDTVAGLAWNARIPSAMAGATFVAPDYLPLLLVVRGLGFDWKTLKQLLMLKARQEPDHVLLKNAFDTFGLISPGTARRLVRLAALDRGATAFLQG